MHAAVARSTFGSSWRRAHFEVKMHKTPQLRSAFGSWDAEKVHGVVAKRISRFRCGKSRNAACSDHFGRSGVVLCGWRNGFCTLAALANVSQTCEFCSSFKQDGERGTFGEDLQRCITRGRRSTRDIFTTEVTQCRRRPPNVAVNWHSRMELRPPTARKSHPNFFAHCKRSTQMKKYQKSIIPNVQNTMRTHVTPMVSNYGKLLTNDMFQYQNTM